MTFSPILTRRSVLQGSALAGALTATAPLAQAGYHGQVKTQGLLSDGNTILFQEIQLRMRGVVRKMKG